MIEHRSIVRKRPLYDVALIVLGAWLVVSPWVLSYTDVGIAATSHATLGGTVIALVALIDLESPTVWDEWVFFCIGLYLSFVPFLFAFTADRPATVNMVLVGLLTITLATAAGNARRRSNANP